MNAFVMGLALALLAQLGGDRYPDASGDAAAGDISSTGGASDDDQPTTLIIPTDTPQPTLVEDAPPADPSSGATPDTAAASPGAEAAANPFDSPNSLRGAKAAPSVPDAGVASGSPPETSVLIGGPRAADLMRNLLTTPMSGQLSGVPVTLGTALRGAPTRADQTARAKTYWELAAATAQYYLALQESMELAALRQGVNSASAAWNEARHDLDRRLGAAHEMATAAQLRLHRLMGADAGTSLPLPADAPHCGRYNTRYDEIFAARPDQVARQLNDVLPLLHGEVAAQARGVATAHDWLMFVSEARDPATDGTGLLRAYELMTERRRAFIDAVRAYNGAIADYAELAAPDEVGADRVVSMLIRVSTANGRFDGAGVEPAAAFEVPAGAGGADDAGNSPQRTFAQRPRSEGWRPLARFRDRERSIVVKRMIERLGGRD